MNFSNFRILSLYCIYLLEGNIAFAQSTPYSGEHSNIPAPLESTQMERVGSAPLPANIDPFIQGNKSGKYTNPAQVPSKINSLKQPSFESAYNPGRVIYLNGVNVSSVRGQELENVNLRIDTQGNIFINAPQYEVSSEQHYHPLLPQELPKIPKQDGSQTLAVPEGVYSKDTGQIADKKETKNSKTESSSPSFPKNP